MGRGVFTALVFVLASGVLGSGASAGCGASDPSVTPRAGPPAALWVLAPHPDDEALFGAEPIRRALRERRDVRVMVMTNGDLGCGRDGHLRQRETVAAMAELGLPEDHIRFLGYPDGALDALSAEPLPERERRAVDGTCVRGATTYASRGEGALDVHAQLRGAPGAYTVENAVGDLAALLERDRPSDVYVAHPIDEHPDHASTYTLLRRALEAARLDALPRVHRCLVHVGGCWPNGDRAREPCDPISGRLGTPYPPLPPPLERYRASERLVVDDGGAQARRAIAQYRSQLHVEVEHDWLGTFARGEAIAWPELLVRGSGRVVRARRPGVDAGALALGPPALRTVDAHGGHIPARYRAPFELVVEARIPASGALEVAWADGAEPPLRLRIAPDAVVFSRGPSEIRRLFVPAVERGRRWSLRVEPRPEDGGVLELELRQDAVPVAWAIAADDALEGEGIDVSVEGGASLDGVRAGP